MPPPDPTPKMTKPTPNTRARNTNTHFACRRSIGKNILSSETRLCVVAWERSRRLRASAFVRFRRFWAAARAMYGSGYLARERLDARPIEVVGERGQPVPRGVIAEGPRDSRLED